MEERDWTHSVLWTAEEETQLASLFEEICPVTPNPFPVLPSLMPENLKLVILKNTSTLLLWVLHTHRTLT